MISLFGLFLQKKIARLYNNYNWMLKIFEKRYCQRNNLKIVPSLDFLKTKEVA